jgi:hypothetical protein
MLIHHDYPFQFTENANRSIVSNDPAAEALPAKAASQNPLYYHLAQW